jgi:hypothetical protein
MWNQRISTNFNRIWYNLCLNHLPINEETFHFDNNNEINFKNTFVNFLNRSLSLDDGRSFDTSQLDTTETNALAVYKNIIATGSFFLNILIQIELNLI